MEINTKENMLIKSNKKGIFYQIKKFFMDIFNKQRSYDSKLDFCEQVQTTVENENKKSTFMEYIKNIEDEETKLLKLQKQYHKGEIREEDLTEEQVTLLCALYDKQIVELKKSNEIKKQKILEYRRKMQTES